MKHLAVVAIALLSMTGCGPKGTPTPGGAGSRYQETPSHPAGGESPAERGLDVGDFEADLSVRVEITPDLRGPQVQVEDMITPKKTLTMSTASVTEPVPEQIWVSVTVKPSNPQNYAKRAVVLQGALNRDEEILSTFATMISRQSTGSRVLDRPLEFRFDVMAGLPEAPETMLVHAEIQVLLLPEGTDPGTIDPETASVDAKDRTVLLSNPVRINFARNGATE